VAEQRDVDDPDSSEVVDLADELRDPPARGWRRVSGPDRYGALLVLIVATIVASVALQDREWERLVAIGLVGLMLVFALRTSAAPVSVQRVALVAVALMFFATAGAHGKQDAWIRAAVAMMVGLVLLVVLAAILRRLSTHLTITWNTVMGALCIYLLFAMICSAVYAAAGHLQDGALFAQQNGFTNADTIYFSLTTLTTVGFGDLSMRTDVTRIISALEAVLGQLYLITAVGLLVGNLGRRRRVVRERRPSVSDGS
jgi:hypothetical protein